MNITAKTKLYALIGSPVAHSGSPSMYNLCFEQAGMDCVYMAFDVGEEYAEKAIEAARTLGICGMNVTMPCKKAAARAVDILSPVAEATGAVNTIVNDGRKLSGYMTDGEGFVKNLAVNGVKIRGRHIMLIGAGGAAAAIEAQCASDGAGEITVFYQRPQYEKSCRDMAARIRELAPACRISAKSLGDGEALEKTLGACDVLVNATSMGMKPRERECPIPEEIRLRPELAVADIVYNPTETRLLARARKAGCVCIGGLGMLLWQGAAAWKLFTGEKMPTDAVWRLLTERIK